MLAGRRLPFGRAGLACTLIVGVGGCLLIYPDGASVRAQTRAATQPVLSYTMEQASTGREAYASRCASCHGDVDGSPTAPPLAGPAFRQNWFGRNVEALFNYTRSRMPPASPGSLPNSTYADIVAYLLARNGLAPGDVPLSASPASLAASLPWQLPQSGGELSKGIALPAPPLRRSPLDGLTPVSDAMLARPPESEWLTWRRTWDSQGFSPLKQITAANVGSLRVAWSWAMPPGPNESTPLFHDGILFAQSWGDKVQALDAATGELLWQYSPGPSRGEATVKRAIALYGEYLYLATSDAHVVALSAKHGIVAWDRPLNEAGRNESSRVVVTGGPLVAKGRVMVGVAGRAAGGNFIVGLDAATGSESWRVYTVARPDSPGGRTWNGIPLEQRTGASVWVPGSYDPALNLAFFGTAQTYDTAPLREASGEAGVTSDALYTDSTLAIDPDTGRLAWHFQHLPNDQWDLDWALERVLFRTSPRGPTLVATAGKQAIYDVLDAGTGKYMFSMDLGLQDVVTAIDPVTGAKRVDRSKTPGAAAPVSVCPHSVGAKSWLPEALDATTMRLYAPLNEACMDLVPVPAGGRSMLSTGVRWTLRPRADSDGLYGRLEAIDLTTRKTAWVVRHRAPVTTGVLATAGGVVFVGRMDRTFAAFDGTTGKELWSIRLNDVPNGAPITYSSQGQQYLALTVGNGGALATTFPMLVPEIRNPPDRAASLWVLALPK